MKWARALKRDVMVVLFAARDPEVPWSARIIAITAAAYALSPIDLIPDFIPVLGLLDDLLIIPAALWLAVRLIPPPVLKRLRAEAAATTLQSFAGRWAAAGFIAVLWGLALLSLIGMMRD